MHICDCDDVSMGMSVKYMLPVGYSQAVRQL